MSRYPLGRLVLENDRLFLVHQTRGSHTKVDVTPVWHFFKEVSDYQNNPTPPPDEPEEALTPNISNNN